VIRRGEILPRRPGGDPEIISPDGGPPRLAVPWVLYGISVIGSIATVVAAAFSAASGGALSGLWLVLVFLAPQVGLLLTLGYQAFVFSRAYQEVGNSFRMAIVGNQQRIQDLETALGKSEGYRGMARQISDVVDRISAELVRANTDLDDKALALLLRKVCLKVATAYSNSSGVACRVCVKQVMEKPDEPGKPYVKAVARDTGTTLDDRQRWHLVEDNTDFEALLFGRLEFWFCTDIQDRTIIANYFNTSPGDHPYRSVVVWPILASTGRSNSDSLTEGYDVAAFLCLDSGQPNAFDKENDVPMGTLVAQALGRAFEAHYASFPNDVSTTTGEKSM